MKCNFRTVLFPWYEYSLSYELGKVKETFFRDAINEYSKRLSKYCVLKIQELPDEKVPLKLNNKISYSIKDKEQ